MTLSDFAKTLVLVDSRFVYSDTTPTLVFKGQINKEIENCVGVYNTKPLSPTTAVGQQSTYENLYIEILLHWGKSYDVAETLAKKIYDYYALNNSLLIGMQKSILVIPEHQMPLDLGRDGNNICEFLISLKILIQK